MTPPLTAARPTPVEGSPTFQKLHEYREVWATHFLYNRPPGERPTPTGLVARECRSGRQLRLADEHLHRPAPPFPTGPDVLVVAFDAPPALLSCLAQDWPVPDRVLDLHAEFRCQTSGLEVAGDYRLQDALHYYGVADVDHIDQARADDALAKLLEAMLPGIDLPRALLRGRYTAAVARMEWTGIPMDVGRLSELREGWEDIQDALIEQVDRNYGVYVGRKFQPRRWAAWLNQRAIPWPRRAPGKLDLSPDTFRDMALVYPEVRPLKELRASLAQFRLFRLAVGSDGRNRCTLRPFASKTGRNQPSTASFIYGPAVWLRGLIKPPEGHAAAYVDYVQQEVGVAAALSQDPAMLEAYASGDAYLAFARQAGAVPADATKQTHKQERELFKQCALGTQYGMGANSLARRLQGSVDQARTLLQLHRQTYRGYWRWLKAVDRHARRDGQLRATFGWTLHVGPGANPRSVRNFLLQANAAEMLRLACCFATEAGVRVCCPVHDALFIEAPVDQIDEAVVTCQRAMEQASQLVLRNLTLRTDVNVVRFPERYMDPRGRAMWDLVFELLDQRAATRGV